MFSGLLLALASGISLGGITSFAALSYQHGVVPLELIALRGIIAALIMVGICVVMRQRIILASGGWRYAMLVGISLAMVGFGYMGSVAFISPGLAVAILYLYPIIVLIADSLKTRQMPPLLTIVGFTIALIGIVSCVGIGGPLNIIGIILAFIASLGMAGFLLSSAAASRNGHDSGIVLWANILIISLAVVALAITRDQGQPLVAPPDNMIGLGAIIAASVLYALGILLSVLALRIAPAPLVALVMNIEPLTTLLAARLIVGENLSLLQYSGMLMAVLGICIGSSTLWRQNNRA